MHNTAISEKLYFNSIKVQLERAMRHRDDYSDHDFNSIKVQLERKKNLLANIRTIFQFHKGTIRTSNFFRSFGDTGISIP